MAVSPLAPQGFKALKRSHRRLWALNLTVSAVVMDQDWNQTGSWHKAKEKSPRGCLRTVGLKAGMSKRLAAYGFFWRLPRVLALIKDRLQRRRQAAVYTLTVTLPLAALRPRRPASCTPWYFDHRVLARSSRSHVSLVSNAQSEGLCAPSPLHQMVVVFSELLFGILVKISFSWNRWETQNNEIAANKSFVHE